MYYKRTTQLPKQIQKSLPKTIQKEYLKVFNSAWEQYMHDQSMTSQEEVITTAHQVAWIEVKW